MTPKQKKLYDFLCDYSEKHGIMPTMNEMQDHMGVRSRSSAHRLVTQLEAKGWVQRVPHATRGLQISSREATLDRYRRALHKIERSQCGECSKIAWEALR